MKFKSITMNNFMRYKSINRIEFECDNESNVTVVLGDNTFGKTTIAQAFRWVLYRDMIDTQYGKKFDLLNYDVLDEMGPNDHEDVSVTLEIVSHNNLYTLKRVATYISRVNEASNVGNKVELQIKDMDEESTGESKIIIDEDEVNRQINELLPRDLSQYFLFDGEKWNNTATMKGSIKESIHKLVGLSGIKKAMYHLYDMRNSVSSKVRPRGNTTVYDNLVNEQQGNLAEIERLNKVIEDAEANYESEKVIAASKLDSIMKSGDAESKQKRLYQMKRSEEMKKNALPKSYTNFINEFSDEGVEFLAQPMISEALKVLSVANKSVKNRGVKYMRQASVDILIERGECICGTKFKDHPNALQHILMEREFLYPATIGQVLDDFKGDAKAWKIIHDKFCERIENYAQSYEEAIADIEELQNQIDILDQDTDKDLDIQKMKREYSDTQKKVEGYSNEITSAKDKRKRFIDRNTQIDNLLAEHVEKTKENEMAQLRYDYAMALYSDMKESFKRKERELLIEINRLMKKNFEKMFNSKDKYAIIDENYNLKLFYRETDKDNVTYSREEEHLSEGERIALNFAFIVSILEYSRNNTEDKELQTEPMPLVLDGPFSKLGDENIGLISSILPCTADQVIIFMLKKDWEYTRLDKYIKNKLYISKNPGEKFSNIGGDFRG